MRILCLTDKICQWWECAWWGTSMELFLFFSPEPNPSTHEQCFPGLLGLNALAHTSPVFQKEKERENQQISQEQPG